MVKETVTLILIYPCAYLTIDDEASSHFTAVLRLFKRDFYRLSFKLKWVEL